MVAVLVARTVNGKFAMASHLAPSAHKLIQRTQSPSFVLKTSNHELGINYAQSRNLLTFPSNLGREAIPPRLLPLLTTCWRQPSFLLSSRCRATQNSRYFSSSPSSVVLFSNDFNKNKFRGMKPYTKSERFLATDVSRTSLPKIRLYQYNICPFCNLTKALLSYSGLEYESIEVNPLTKAELKPWSGEYRKVPIALIDERQVNGSEEILDFLLDLPLVQNSLQERWNKLDSKSQNSSDTSPEMTLQRFHKSDNALRWKKFATEELASLLYPNICGTFTDAYHAFGYVESADSFSKVQKFTIRWLGALAMHFAASKVKSKRKITDERAALRSALDLFDDEGLNKGAISFSSGHPRAPDMGDMAIFGVLRSVQGLNAHTDSIQVRGGAVKEWYDRMHLEVFGTEAEHKIKLCVSCEK